MIISDDKIILIVDDVKKAREFTRNVLEKLGFKKFLEAENGLEALRLLKDKTVHLVITDWQMPRLDGLALIRAIKKDNTLNNIPVIMISAETSFEKIKLAINEGLSGYILKPYSLETLKQKIEAIDNG